MSLQAGQISNLEFGTLFNLSTGNRVATFVGGKLTPTATSVPEPDTLALLAVPLGVAGVLTMRRRGQNASARVA